ncbi:MAG: type II secretion system protein GspG [Verrucomicrobiales bacterium]
MRCLIPFTILLLFLAALFLLGILFPKTTGPAKKAKALNDVSMLATALHVFYLEYGHLPSSEPATQLSTLMGDNPHQMVFIDPPPNQIVGGNFVDPWQFPYRTDFSDSQVIRVWSTGPDGSSKDGADRSDDIQISVTLRRP